MTNEDMAAKLIEVDQRSQSNTRRINELAEHIDAVNRLATAVEVMATEQRHQTETIQEVRANVVSLSGKVEAIEQKPAKRWDSLVEKILWALIAAVLGVALARIGLAT